MPKIRVLKLMMPSLLAVALAVGVPRASAQAMRPVQPVSPTINPSSVPTNCAPGHQGQPNACSSMPTLTPMPTIVAPPQPVPLPVPAPPALASGGPGAVSEVGEHKVLTYFQRAKTDVDATRALTFVVMPKSAVTANEKELQEQFCQIVLASMTFVTPGTAIGKDMFATYWPIVPGRTANEIETAFGERDCAHLVAWYDHTLARTIAARTGITGRSGPFLITWPAQGPSGDQSRSPLLVDFSKADYDHASKLMTYWFRQLRYKPELWTDYIREGTIRAEIADAINETAGVALAVLSGKWESIETVSGRP
jgi:hypothetical protein